MTMLLTLPLYVLLFLLTIASDPVLRILLCMDAQEVGYHRDATTDEPRGLAYDLPSTYGPLGILQIIVF